MKPPAKKNKQFCFSKPRWCLQSCVTASIQTGATTSGRGGDFDFKIFDVRAGIRGGE